MAGSVTGTALASFAADVRDGLTRYPKQLPPKYFYDDLGSALFDAICRLPWYRITRSEIALLVAHADDITRGLDDDGMVVELGSGNGEKILILAAALQRRRVSPVVHLIDISAKALADASDRLATADVQVVAHHAFYEDGLPRALERRHPSGCALVLFLGSNIGNFDPPAASAMLARIRGELTAGDLLLLGADLVKPVGELILAYDDPLGITAAFNRNLLVRMNRELDADFDLAAFEHHARWNAEAQSVEMHLVSVRDQRVQIPGAGIEIECAAGESIWTESSFKYETGQLESMGRETGFRVAAQWIDPATSYALTLFAAH